MVWNARLDLPLPLGPVMTVNRPNGRSTSIPLRLFWRAPRISMQSFRVGVITRSLFPIFEATGDFRCQSSSSQISGERGRTAKNRLHLTELSREARDTAGEAPALPSQPEAFRQLLALFLQLFGNHAA